MSAIAQALKRKQNKIYEVDIFKKFHVLIILFLKATWNLAFGIIIPVCDVLVMLDFKSPS